MMRTLQLIEEAESRHTVDHLHAMQRIEELLNEQASDMPVGTRLTTAEIERAAYKLHAVCGRVGGATAMMLRELEGRPLYWRMGDVDAVRLVISARMKEAEDCIGEARREKGKAAMSDIRLASVNLHLALGAMRRLHQESGL